MTTNDAQVLGARAQRVPVLIAGVVGGIATLVLVGGWLLGIGALRSFAPIWSPMAPLTALLLMLLSGAVIWFETRPAISNVLLLLGFLLAASVLGSYLFDLRFGLEQLTAMFRRAHTPLPELPAPDTAAAAVMLALAMLCLRTTNVHWHDFADVVCTVIVIICLQVLIAYVYSVAESSSFLGFRQIAPHSTLSVLLLGAAVIAHRRTYGIFTAMTGGQQSASVLRRMIPITVLLCIIVGWLHVLAIREQLGGTMPELVAWTMTGAFVVLALLLFVTSAEMRNVEATVRKRQEELLAATAAAEAASEAKSRFMGVMSHELRTPLTAMIGYADLLDAGLAGELTPQGRNFMNRIRASGWHLVGLIDAVLFYAGGRMPAEHAATSRVSIAELVREIVRMFVAQAKEKSLTLELTEPAQPIVVDVDERKLRQILINLLSNAIKFTESGGVYVRVRPDDSTISIEVTDTGIGLDTADLARIWEPFNQVDASHTRKQGGVGLGLALTRRLVEQMGATIDARSEKNAGTTFVLKVPRTDGEIVGKVRLQDVRIVVVDDEAIARNIVVRALARYGAYVNEAETGAQALATIESNASFDVLVSDISMPGMTGIELALTLRARGIKIPILFLTGAELSAREHNEIEDLGVPLITKPFDMVDLARNVQSLIAGKTPS